MDSKKMLFVTKKIFVNGEEITNYKVGYLPDVEKIKATKFKNKLKNEIAFDKIDLKQNEQLSFERLNKFNKDCAEFNNNKFAKLKNAMRAMSRSKKQLFDLLKNNEFDYFVTLTFNNKLDRLNDDVTCEKFKNWICEIKRKLKTMIYVAVPEYHKKGGLHYHLLLGNVSSFDLELVASGQKVKSGKTKGQTIYNVTMWRKGFSSATKIMNNEAVKFYVTKYLTKGAVDPRFYNQKRFYVSQNIKRPLVEKVQCCVDQDIDLMNFDKDKFSIDYYDQKKQYLILSKKMEKE